MLRKKSWLVYLVVLFMVVFGSLSMSVVASAEPASTLVVKGYYDRIEDILTVLSIDYHAIYLTELASYDLKDITELYINCGSGSSLETIDIVKTYVEAGGNLFVSDLSYPYIEPWGLKFSPIGNTGNVTAKIEDPGLRGFLEDRDEINIRYDLSGWAIITDKGPATTLLSGNVQTIQNSPLAVMFKAGKGNVVFTTFHNIAGQEMQTKTVEYFAWRPVSATTAQDVVKGLGLDPEKIKSFSANTLIGAKNTGVSVSGIPQGTSGIYIFAITNTIMKPQESSGMNAFNKACNVSLFKPNGSLYKTIDMNGDVVAINVPAAENSDGNWTFKVNSYSGYDDNSMVLAISYIGEVSGGDDDDCKKILELLGCNTGAGFMSLVVLAVMTLSMYRKKN